jgi:hypothetical protein
MTPRGLFGKLRGLMSPRAVIAVTLVCVLNACRSGGNPDSFGGGSQASGMGESESSGSGASSSSSSSTGSSSTSSSSDGTSSDLRWDMGVPDFDSPPAIGCQGKIDFLFAVSTSGTMKVAQEQLLASFPGFAEAIAAQLPDFDVHVLVANTDESWAIEDCGVCTEGCDAQGEPPLCGAEITVCDKKIGAGVTFPTGLHASNRRCELDSDRRYITSDQQDMEEVFSCVAQVGVHGSAITAEAMVEALQPTINDPTDEDACNREFLRDDALLIVTLIDDGYDNDSPGTVESWIESLRTAKSGDDDAFAVLVLTTDVDIGYEQLCLPNEFNPNKNRLRLLAEGVEHGFIESICKDSFAPFFMDSVAEIVELCDEFVVPG